MSRFVHAPRVFALICALSSPNVSWGASGVADEAELQFQLGAERYMARDFRGALEHFLASNRLVPNRNVVYNIARTFEQLKRYPDAHRYYTDALSGEVDPAVQKDIEAAIARISEKVAVLRVETNPPGATIYIDRKDLGSRGLSPRPLGLPEGRYKVIVELEGYESRESEVIEARVGAEKRVQLDLVRILGTVKISAVPGTEVFVDGQEAASCQAPCQLELPPGLHAIRLVRAGYEPASKQVNVVARQTVTVTEALAALTGSVVVHADERDALVEIDGRAVGFTPAVISGVTVGPRKVRISLRGHRTVERDIVVEANRQTELLGVSLVPLQEVTAASRFTESVEDAPGSVSIIGGPELRAFAYPTIAEAIRGLRGIALTWDGVYDSIAVRGLGQPNDYGNRMLVLGDGAALNDNILYSSYVGYDARADLGDVDRIEVVRGPGSILYGTGAVSGVINLVTRAREAPTRVFGALGVAGTSAANGRAGFQLNLGEKRGLWASVSGARSDGFPVTFFGQDELGARVERTAHEVDRFRARTLTGAAWWGPVALQWLYTTRDMRVPLGAFGFTFDDPRSRYVDRRALLEARLDLPLGAIADLLVRSHANLYRFQGDYVYEDSVADERYDGLWVGGETRLALNFWEDRFRVSVGGEVQRHIRAEMQGDSIAAGVTETYLDEDHPFTQGAFYALADLRPLERLKIQAGGRLDVYSTFGATLNPRLAAILKATPNDVVKLIAGRAFRAPSVYEIYYNDGGTSQIAANADGGELKPETSYTGELEYTRRLTEDWSLIVAGHSTYVRDIIETRGEATPEAPLQYFNSPEPVLTLGGDLEVRREWRQGWMLSGMYGYQLARYIDLPEGAATDRERLPNAPQHFAGLRGVAPLVPALAVLAVRVSLEAPRRVNMTSEETTRTGVVTDVVLSGQVERYGLSYAAGVYNALDWKYALPVTEGWPASTMPQVGRTFRLNLGLAY